ncbi:MAG: peptide chain release factor 2 [Rhodocyclales bacterium CG17_big_fil_post_rev_8_21_14_2_50_68_7]|nr:MAG: peptide chain release factor 2 [Rhodocyclales bacterium CG17_big_fil_post_rev_8_21_14_2_50_68_7]PIX74722.1 MAG: peptide chain release factor 2 [Rhodocyclales bacterium CG_4_10_14_3_um_filter_68_10]PJA56646.1 MAG: peptide chain release factor 2 [Rhodocyclales bacterium CG_4_9_14_3_um_filter_68_10]
MPRPEHDSWKPNASTPSPTASPISTNARATCGGFFDYEGKRARLEEVSRTLEDPAVWGDAAKAQALGRDKKAMEAVVGGLDAIGRRLAESSELLALARAERDDETLEAVGHDLEALEQEVAGMEFRRMFSNPLDAGNCFVDIQAGAGGTEAQDWASMLLRMYLRYCERKGFAVEFLEESEGEVAGIKTASVKVSGDHAYGILRTETGIHRLVRKSPFDSNARRHTSFASVFVYPEVDESIAIEINPAELRVDTYRASGAGGQHINKTDSAVRITHLPTGIVVQCQNDRSQHRNRAEAMAMLKSRLYEFELRKRQAEQQKLEDSKTDIGWGHQIRSYVLDQSRIKDLRTNVEIGNTQAVLDGDLDPFIQASLKQGA